MLIGVITFSRFLENTLDDAERAIDDGVNTFKTLCKDPRIVAGAGATEIELAKQLAAFGATREGEYAVLVTI